MEKNRRLIGVTLVVLLIVLPLGFDLPGDWLLIKQLQNSGHAVLFGVVTLALRMLICWCWWRALVFGVIVGSLIEVVQFFTGGDCDPEDVYVDILGCLAGLAIAEGLNIHQAGKSVSRVKYRWWVLSCVIGIVALYQPIKTSWLYWRLQQQFPLLCNFDEVGIATLIETYEDLVVTLEPAPSAWAGNHSQVAKMLFPASGWPGLSLVDLEADWTGKKAFQVDVWSPNSAPVKFNIALRSRQNRSDHHDISRHFMVQPGLNTVTLSLDDLRDNTFADEPLLRNIGRVILFSSSPPAGTVLYVDNLRLF